MPLLWGGGIVGLVLMAQIPLTSSWWANPTSQQVGLSKKGNGVGVGGVRAPLTIWGLLQLFLNAPSRGDTAQEVHPS